jgi:predicted amidohydrolase YtcJ
MTANGPHAFVAGRVLTMDPWYPAPAVVVIEHGRIVAVGDRTLLAAYPKASIHDLGGRTLVPGFIDAHNHLSIAALHPLWADISAVHDSDGLRVALLEQATREPAAHWIRGAGWNEANGGLLLDRHDLDALGLDRPVLVAHYTLHQCAVSSAGLDALGIGRDTADPPGGLIVREPGGVPSGLLIERAWSEAHARSMAAYHDPQRWAERFAARARELLREGITCVHDAACSLSAEAVYRGLAKAGALPISVLMMPHPEALLTRVNMQRLDGPVSGEGDELLRVGAVKLFADGGVAPAMEVSIAGHRGEPLGIAFPGLTEDVVSVLARGFRVAVHAIGNIGLRNTLEAFKRAARVSGDAERRFRIEHACLAEPGQIADMAALGVVGVVQPGFVHHVGQAVEGVPFDDAVWLAFGDMQRAGVHLAASSDDPCAFYEPRLTSALGVTRRTRSGGVLGPEQALGYEEWLRAYTAGAAYAGGQEHERGSITPGKRADLVVLDGDLDAENPPRVVETWVGGQRVYAA